MAYYIFKVKNSKGEIIEDSFQAKNLSEAATKLEQKGFTLLEIKEENNENTSTEVLNVNYSENTILSIKEKKDFFSAFHSLYKSGHSPFEIFNSIHRTTHNAKIKSVCAKILQGIKNGNSLKVSMKPCAKALGTAYTMLVIAGEESGKLEETLSGIINNIITQEKVKNDIISKVTYPIVIICLAIFIAIIFKTFIPELLKSQLMGTETPIIKIVLKSVFEITVTFGIIGGIGFALYKNKNFTSQLISNLATIKPFKNLIKNYTYSNYFSVLSLAYSAGIPLTEALFLSSTVVNIKEAVSQLYQVAPRVQQGCELTTALGATMLFSDYAISQISSGEKAGELEKTLAAVAYDYESQLKTTLEVMLKLLEPLMIIIIGIIVLSVLLIGNKQINEMLIQNLF